MGMFSRNRTGLGSYSGEEIAANENYYGELGALQIALEGVQNDQDIFMACLENDFEETAGLMSGAITESQIIEEAGGAISSFFDKIKAAIKKLWEKIKGLFNTFIKKINTVIIRDNKKFVDKYKREVLSKDLSKMKFKASKPKDGTYGKLKDKRDASLLIANTTIDETINEIVGGNDNSIKKINEELNDGTFMDDLCSGAINAIDGGNSDSDSFEKDFHEALFEDPEEHEGLPGGELSDIIGILVEKKLVSDLETTKKKVDKVFSDYLKVIDKAMNKMSSNIPSSKDGSVKNSDYKVAGYDNVDITRKGGEKSSVAFKANDKDSKDFAMQRLTTIQRTVTVTQSFFSRVSSCQIKEMKFLIAQARSIFAKAVTYNPKKSANENAVFMEAAGDAAIYDVMSSFESYEM